MTDRIQPNVFDEMVAMYVDVIKETSSQIRHDGKNVRPYGDGLGPSEKLSEDEEVLLFQNPAEHVRLKWPDLAMDATTGLPITNQQASWILVDKLGPENYVKYYRDSEKLVQKLGGMPSA